MYEQVWNAYHFSVRANPALTLAYLQAVDASAEIFRLFGEKIHQRFSG